MKWYLRTCPVCTGNLHDDLDDPGWLTCFMCARTFRGTELPNVGRGAMSESGLANGRRARPGNEGERVAGRKAA
jgi:hypothetical protein